MTIAPAPGYVVADTSVLSYFTARSRFEPAYRGLLAGKRIALSFFVITELDGRPWGESRRARLELLYRECVRLPPPGEATSTWYNRARAKRRDLGLGSGVGDTDLWIIAQAAEYGIPYMSHDGNACAVARALGVEVLPALPEG